MGYCRRGRTLSHGNTESLPHGDIAKTSCAAFKKDIIRNTTKWLPQQMAKGSQRASFVQQVRTRNWSSCGSSSLCTRISESVRELCPLAHSPMPCVPVHHRHVPIRPAQKRGKCHVNQLKPDSPTSVRGPAQRRKSSDLMLRKVHLISQPILKT